MRGGCRGVVPPRGSRAKPSHARGCRGSSPRRETERSPSGIGGCRGVVPPRIIAICRSPRSRCPPPCGRGTCHGLMSSTSPRPQNVKPPPPAKPQHPRPSPRPRRQSLPRPFQRHQHRAAAADAGLKASTAFALPFNRDHKALTSTATTRPYPAGARGAKRARFLRPAPVRLPSGYGAMPLIEWCVVIVRAVRGLARASRSQAAA